jgi:hypothetical protein
VAAGTYYSRRSARDPAGREAQIQGARERERRRRELDPDGLRTARREATRRCREKQAAHGLTFQELLQRSPRNDPASLRLVLREEIALGRIEYHSTTRRFTLNGKLPAGVNRALRDLEL